MTLAIVGALALLPAALQLLGQACGAAISTYRDLQAWWRDSQ